MLSLFYSRHPIDLNDQESASQYGYCFMCCYPHEDHFGQFLRQGDDPQSLCNGKVIEIWTRFTIGISSSASKQ